MNRTLALIASILFSVLAVAQTLPTQNTAVVLYFSDPTGQACQATDTLIGFAGNLYSCQGGFYAILNNGPGGNVNSVFGRTGNVTASNGDYNFSQLSGSATVAQVPTGTSGHLLPFLDGVNTWAAQQTFSANIINNSSAGSFALSLCQSAGSGSCYEGFDASRAFVGFDGTDAIIQAAASKGIKFAVNNNTFGSGLVGGLASGGAPYGISATIASAATIAPATPVVIITGTTPISTITVPSECATANYACHVNLIADPTTGPFTLTASGNIYAAAAPLIGQIVDLTYLPANSKWYALGASGSGGSMVYPAAGVGHSSGTAWDFSYTVGASPNNLVQLDSSGRLPAVSAANLTNFPVLNQSTTGNAATATALAAQPSNCSAGFAPTGSDARGNSLNCQAIGSGGGGFTYPPSGVPQSSGTAWLTSLQLGVSALNLVQLNSFAQFPAIDMSLLTNLSVAIDGNIGNTVGSILYRDTSGWLALAPGANGFYLQTQGSGAAPQWAAGAGGGTNVASAGNGVCFSGTPPNVTGYTCPFSRTVTTASDVLQLSDMNKIVRYTDAAQVAISVPQPGTTVIQSAGFTVSLEGAGGAVLTPSSSTIGGAATVTLVGGTQGQPNVYYIYTDGQSGSNWNVGFQTYSSGNTNSSSLVSGNLTSANGTNSIVDSGLATSAVATLTGSQSLSNKTLVAAILGTPASGNLVNGTGYLAANLVGTTLPSSIVTSSLTALGTIATGTWNGTTIAVNHGGSGVTTSTGSGNLVLSSGPTLVGPILGTPVSVNLANALGLPLSGLASQAANTFIANNTGSSATPIAITVAQANVLLATAPASSSTFGVSKCDGVTITCSSGTMSSTGVSAGVASANAQTGITNQNIGGVVSDFFHIAASMALQNDIEFGASATSTTGNAITNITDLATLYNPYGIAGTTPINSEWERYQTFNTTNFVFNSNNMALTATYQGGGLAAGNIFSGQIVSKANYQPGLTGFVSYAFDLRRKVVGACGSWPAFWLYSSNPNGGGAGGASEIDDFEFFNESQPDKSQSNCTSGSGPGFYSSITYTGNQHGSGVGTTSYNLKTVKTGADYWQPGMDFSADFHDYQVLWTPSTVCKYIDGLLVSCDAFTWTSGQGTTTTTAVTTASTTVHVASVAAFNTAGSAIFSSWVQCPTTCSGIPVGTYVTAINSGALTITTSNAVTIPNGTTISAYNPSQYIANFAYGTDNTSGFPGMQPISTSQFPAADLIQYIKIWGSQKDLTPTIAAVRY